MPPKHRGAFLVWVLTRGSKFPDNMERNGKTVWSSRNVAEPNEGTLRTGHHARRTGSYCFKLQSTPVAGTRGDLKAKLMSHHEKGVQGHGWSRWASFSHAASSG